MYSAEVTLNKKMLKGTLDFYVIVNTQKELQKLNIEKTIHGIFKSLGELDMTCISALLIQAILRLESLEDYEITELYSKEKTLEDIDNNFMSIFSFLHELMSKCMPKNTGSIESEFEEVEDGFLSDSDWDIAYMEYLWTTTLQRDNFWETTPKNFFEQVDIYKKMNGIKDEEFEEL